MVWPVSGDALGVKAGTDWPVGAETLRVATGPMLGAFSGEGLGFTGDRG